MTRYARIQGGTVMETISSTGAIEEMFHPDLEWHECDEDIEPGWGYSNGTFSPPAPPSLDELTARAVAEKTQLMNWASEMILPLQDAVDLEEATSDELILLKAWKKYRVNLNRIEGQENYPESIDWPDPPV